MLLYADDISLVCDDIESVTAAVTLMDNTFVLVRTLKQAESQTPNIPICNAGWALQSMIKGTRG